MHYKVGKVGRVASENVVVELLKTNFFYRFCCIWSGSVTTYKDAIIIIH